ncbi:MAG: cyclic nucleotide-binding domain-containing protein [Chitinivibrionales bacterium]|nr:cyclic nucleotide-binding domain-containing protein [Chitinivibrionales bacterium]
MADLSDNQEVREYKPGDVVIQEGKLAEGLFILMAGKVDVVVKEVKVAEISDKGAFIGEIASLLRCRRIASVQAVEPTRVIYIRDITEHFTENPAVAFSIAKTLASRIMDLNSKIVDYQKEVEAWVEKGITALETGSFVPFEDILKDMQQILHKSRAQN